jgi:hypothetical protein
MDFDGFVSQTQALGYDPRQEILEIPMLPITSSLHITNILFYIRENEENYF